MGKEVKMVCPIIGNPTPIIEWEKVRSKNVKIPKLCNTCLGRMVRWWTTLGHGSRPTKTISR